MITTRGIVFDIKKYSIHDGPGIRTTVFLKGCPLKCWWCQNPESQKLEPEIIKKINRRKRLDLSYSETIERIGREISAEEVIAEIERDLLFYDQSGGGVTFSGGEPLMQPDFLYELLSECKKREIHTALDTSGYGSSEVMSKISEKVDLFLYDLKLMDEKKHIKYTSVTNKPILENLRQLSKENKKIIIRIPVIPGIIDTDENINQIIEFVLSLNNVKEISLLPYNHLGDGKYTRLNIPNKMANLKLSPSNPIEKIKEKFENKNFKVKIGG